MAGQGPTIQHRPRVRLTLGGARAGLLWERAWRLLWAPAAVAAALAGLLFMDVPRAIGPWPWIALMAVGVLAALVAIWRARRNLSWPRHEEVRRRVELSSALAHRPLTALEDRQATGVADHGASALWQLHRARVAMSSGTLRAGWPRPGVAERDRWGLRGMAVLLLVVGLIAAGGQWRDRLAHGVVPEMAGVVAVPAPVTLDLYITPPAYTRLPPIYRSTVDGRPVRAEARRGSTPAPPPGEAPASETGPIAVPAGSVLAARVNGAGSVVPVLDVNAQETAFEAAGGSHEIQATITSGRELVVTHGGDVLGRWPIAVVPDHPPTIEFAEEPGVTRQHALVLTYRATDDYGIAEVRARLSLSPDAPQILDRPDIDLEMPVPGRLPREAEAGRIESLIRHVWAGFPVLVELTATDAAGQTGRSDPRLVTLPEFPFQHPVARALIDQRRTLLIAPDQVRTVVETLQTLSERPDRFYDDTVVFLALRTAARRLALVQGLGQDLASHIEPVQNLLWDTAMRLEGGELQMALQRLRNLQEQLRNALSDPNSTDEQIAELMDQLREAMDAYMQQMQQAMQQALDQGLLQQQMMEPGGEVISRDDLQRMIDQMQNLSESGARDQAQQLLSELQRMMEGMVPMPNQAGQDNSPGMQMLQDLQNLMDSQRRLMDETFQESMGQGTSGEGAADRQDQLRERLGQLGERLEQMMGESPDSLDRAGEAMGDAARNLRDGRPEDAVGDQGRALEELQQGLAGLAEELMEQMTGGRDGRREAAGVDRRGRDRDPLGRPLRDSQSASTQDIRIPDEMDVQRAREILMELRHRLSQRDRPTEELDYLERLLQLF